MRQSISWNPPYWAQIAMALFPICTSLKVGVMQTPPATTSCSLDTYCPDRGYSVTASMKVCEYLKLNCTYRWLDGEEYGDVDDSGIGTGMMGYIQRGDVDMTLPLLTPTYRRSRGVAFSNIFFYSKMILITRATQANRGKLDLTLFHVFQWPVTLGFFLALAIIAVLLTITTSMDQDRARMSRRDYLIRNGATLVSKRYHDSIVWSIPNRVLITTWGLGAIVLAASYTGILFSTKIIDESNAPFKDFDSFADCLEAQKCRLVMPTTQISYYFMLSDTERMSKVFAKNPVQIVPEEKIPKAILAEKSVYLVWFWFNEGFNYDARELDICQFYSVETTYTEQQSICVRKGSPILNTLNMMALRYRENGVADAMMEKYDTGLDTCGGKGFQADLGIYSMLTIFYLYILGIMFSVFAFLLEGSRTWIRLCCPQTVSTVRSMR